MFLAVSICQCSQSVNAQELGDFEQSWQYAAAACSMCIALGLYHDSGSTLSLSCTSSAQEASYCFFASYIIDKGLAMNLGRPSCLPDDHIEIDLRSIVGPSKPELRQVLQNYYLDLAIAQSGIVSIRAAKAKGFSAHDIDRAKHVSGVLEDAWLLIKDVSPQVCRTCELDQELMTSQLSDRHKNELASEDLEYEHRMAKFSYHNICTVFHHLCSRERALPEPGEKSAALKFARAAMCELHSLLDLSRRSEFDSYKLNSFVYW